MGIDLLEYFLCVLDVFWGVFPRLLLANPTGDFSQPQDSKFPFLKASLVERGLGKTHEKRPTVPCLLSLLALCPFSDENHNGDTAAKRKQTAARRNFFLGSPPGGIEFLGDGVRCHPYGSRPKTPSGVRRNRRVLPYPNKVRGTETIPEELEDMKTGSSQS